MENKKKKVGRPQSENKYEKFQISLSPENFAHLEALSGGKSHRSGWIAKRIENAWALREQGLVAVTLTQAQVDALRALGFKFAEGKGKE